MIPELLFAKLSPVICYAPGLFRSFGKTARTEDTIELRYTFNSDVTYVFTGPQLGVNDLLALQGLVALGTMPGSHRRLSPAISSRSSKIEWNALKALYPDTKRKKDELVFVKETYTTLAKVLSYKDCTAGKTHKLLYSCLRRMASVRVTLHSSGKKETQPLLQIVGDDAYQSEFSVIFGPLLTTAIFATKGEQYLRLNMDEVRGLSYEPARLLHLRLHWMNQGASKSIKLATLSEYIWPEPTSTASLTRLRRLNLKTKALAELKKIGWQIALESTESVEVTRPMSSISLPDSQTDQTATEALG
ncbi:MAG: hypothetical protein HHJ15_07340 [Rhodoferax sp.]|uniref:replication protein C, IncQ-type n=1 Tax=Rhodoferax sp. TaxID=50421 RepID=UPI0017F6982A|nr:replication protein C, IncQ-type [Rhodoferax sp.]NMM19743.1 hypothetical protein [Rhodoferax sp.]